MKTILVNGLNSKVGGGKSILNNFLASLSASKSGNIFYVLTPRKRQYERHSCGAIRVIDIKPVFKSHIAFPIVNHIYLPRLMNDLKVDAILNLADIVIPTRIPQAFLFDWAYALYPESVAWQRMGWKSYLERKIKLLFFKKYLRYAKVVIAQNETMQKRLQCLYGLSNVTIVPNAVSVDHFLGGEPCNFNLPKDRIKFLYLTYYYSHKNIEIFLPLARKIRGMNLPYSLVLTIAPWQHPKARELLNAIQDEGLFGIVINLGPVKMNHVPSLYSQCDALLMPTLLESFSGTYVEAMYHQIPILTSNLDFARDVCGEAAFYFDPLDVESILTAMREALENTKLRQQKIEAGIKKLSEMPDWKQAFEKYLDILKVIME